jgi:hypothetical protein
MFRDDLETIILWSFQGLDHGVIDDLSDGLAVFHRFALSEFDASEWHGLFPFRVQARRRSS